MRWWLQAILILLFALGGAIGSTLLVQRPDLPALSQDEWLRTPAQVAELGNVLWIDARNVERFEAGHLENAVNVSLDDWDTGFGELISVWSPDDTIVVYCDGEGCELSRETAEHLRKDLGQENVYWLEGGYEAWLDFAP
ncbi:rhodanese-like domain-containing protein [Cerasicoccus arenae]|uniref:Rhodanese domain-containing protein n=1 Tax=Cerasicoccus arenae TaxID=424488 RepID=A0A8J3D9H2_9BACT|nr:rhodanese-like domain-containing protein [Cerasicoccus arenae]MBK1859671.1 rhodanese-like domain-containing protein [Cerasicoccus arenae]GHB92955.1 hypothetical protein GCM10007047_05400 [Cerasicoccus arenae]